jgi:hypothetical protein
MSAAARHINRLHNFGPGLAAACAGIGLALACALMSACAAAAATSTPSTPSTSAAPVRYRVVNLGAGQLADRPSINASGQVAFAL